MFYIVIKSRSSKFFVVGEKDDNVAKKLGLSAEVGIVPPEDHALVLLEVDIDHLPLRHYIIIQFISQAYLSQSHIFTRLFFGHLA